MLVEKIGSDVQDGDLIRIQSSPDGMKVEFLKEKTESVKKRARAIKNSCLGVTNKKAVSVPYTGTVFLLLVK
ncbi:MULTISPECIES: hypothetical protein [Bacillaceae]|uniref:Uncharacterized protein n=1 Tax=Domibacillus aminovorans TaxID=29332 RepID=A0A177KWM7_9BACI|nr:MULTISPECIES: hypothetical protein [Bacillaceae]OAH57762.1 hypothetical protein AWH48_01715 [Domibacillus aminovorans]